MKGRSLGRHVLADFFDVTAHITDVEAILMAMRQAVDAMDATLLELKSHEFLPQGLTAVAILSESHLALHSWPEQDYVAIDAFTCGQTVQAEAGIAVLRALFLPRQVSIHQIVRGQADRSSATNASWSAF